MEIEIPLDCLTTDDNWRWKRREPCARTLENDMVDQILNVFDCPETCQWCLRKKVAFSSVREYIYIFVLITLCSVRHSSDTLQCAIS